MKAPDSVVSSAKGRMAVLAKRIENRVSEIEHQRKLLGELTESQEADHKELSEIRGWLREMERVTP